MVIVSNGFNKFHLSVAAAEAHRRGNLTLLLTGAYPNVTVDRLIAASTRFPGKHKIARLAARKADIPHSLVQSLSGPETVHCIALRMSSVSSFKRIAQRLNVLSHRLYARMARGRLSALRGDARIYHYRAGYGLESVSHAKSLGMVALCDHSIAHPRLLSYLSEHAGQLPPPEHRAHLDEFWCSVLWDIEQADAVVVNSDFVKRTFLHEKYPIGRLHLIYLGVDEQFMRALPNVRRSAQAGPLKMLFAGSFQRRKGVEQLLTALALLADLPWRLEIAGAIDNGILCRYRKRLADPRITLLGDLARTELAERMAKTEVFIFPSLVEGSARVVFEALAAGCYVITTPNSGSIVRDGLHGALVPPGDALALTGAIRRAWLRRS